MELLLTFIFFNILNVIIQTIKSICTIKCGKGVAAIANAVAYGLYTYIVILMVCELPTLEKCLIIGLCNLVGVYIVKFFEEKAQKEKLWKIEVTVPAIYTKDLDTMLKDVPHSYNILGKHTLFNCYCSTKQQTAQVKAILDTYEAKYFISENRHIF